MRKLYIRLDKFSRKDIEETIAKNNREYLQGWIKSLDPKREFSLLNPPTKEQLEVIFWQIYEQRMKDIIRKGANVDNFGDPVEWQRRERKDRNL